MSKVFISYSWEDEEHKRWVRLLADNLLENGMDATLDQYDLSLGDRLPYFMEQSVANADYVLVICTPTYKEKSDARKGGVGYEGHIISEELMSKGNERKFIPIIRKGTVHTSMPKCLAGKLAVDLTEGIHYETNFKDLLATLHGVKRKPTLKNPAHRLQEVPITNTSNVEDEPIHILGIITDQVTVPRMDGTRGSALYKIPFRLSKRPSELWRRLFIELWNHPPRFTTMHRCRIASVYGDVIELDGTTIEEVRDYHRETLMLCVDEANKAEQRFLDEERQRKAREEERKKEHYSNVDSIANDIKF